MKRGRVQNLWNNISLKYKMLFTFIVPITLILFANIFMYVSINATIEKVNQIYDTNINLNELSESLTVLQSSIKEYLENKGTSALDSYYRAEQNYRDRVNLIEPQWSDAAMAVMEENIINQSEEYLAILQEAVQAKRGRNVEKYRSAYKEANLINEDIQNCIYALNSNRFRTNTNNYSQLLASLRRMEFIMIIILIVIGIASIIIVIMITTSVTTPITELSFAANEVASGNFDISISAYDVEDEIGIMSSAFRQMVESLQRYIEEIRESMHRESELKERELVMESRMKEVQLRSLQAQINPHFLFNTLNAGAQLAMLEDAEKTTEFISNMADFFRYNIKKINNDASIEEEVTMVDRYIYILNVRFTGEIHYSKNIDETVSDIRVPSMILQPLVENAVEYGIRNIDWEGHIDLKVYKDDGFVYMSVKDNGAGMSADKINSILSGRGKGQKDPSNSGSNGIGLGNVIERVKIFTGEEDVIEIYSEGENQGTEFVIKIPLEEKD